MEWLFCFLIVLFAAIIQSSTGFGFAIVAIPLFIWLFPPHYAISLSGFLSLISCLSTLPRVRKDVDRAVLKRIFYGSVLGLPLGGLFYYYADVSWLKVIVSIAILVSAAVMMFKFTIPVGEGRRVGFVSGFLTSSIGMPGPPIVMFLINKNVNKLVFRGTSIAYYCLVYPISLGLQVMSGRFETNWLSDLALIPAIFIGQAIGSALHRSISQEWFRRVTFVLLLATAVNALANSF